MQMSKISHTVKPVYLSGRKVNCQVYVKENVYSHQLRGSNLFIYAKILVIK